MVFRMCASTLLVVGMLAYGAVASVLLVVSNVTIASLGQSAGVVSYVGASGSGEGVLVEGDRCIIDGRIPNVLRFPVGTPQRYVCDALGPNDPCALATLSHELNNPAGDADELEAFLTMNTSLAPPGAMNASHLPFPSSDSGTDGDPVESWYATIRFSRSNISSTCVCVERAFLVTASGRTVEDTVLLELLRGNDPSVDPLVAAATLVTPCVFGVGVGVAPDGGVGTSTGDRLMYDPLAGSMLRFQTASDLTAARRVLWNGAAKADVLNPTFFDNRSATPALNHFALRPASPAAATLMDLPSSTMATLWFGRLMFCNEYISDLRVVYNGVWRSSGVLVAVDWSLAGIYAILPLEMAKSIAIRSTIVEEGSCVTTCSRATNTPPLLDRLASAPCTYRCLLVGAYQPNATMTAQQRRDLDVRLSHLIAPLFVNVYTDDVVQQPAVQLNLSFYLDANAGGTQRYLTLTTWPLFADDRTPTLLLGGAFCTSADLDKAKFIVLDRFEYRAGISPTVSSTLLSTSTVPAFSDVCLPTPVCDDNEVLIIEINKCVSTTCSDFLFMEVNPSTGECWLKAQFTIAAGVMFVLAVAGELLLAYLSVAINKQLRLSIAK